MQIFLYKTEHKQIWDGFIKNSKNGHFIHLRDYMEYHSDRFADNSILFFEDNNLIGTNNTVSVLDNWRYEALPIVRNNGGYRNFARPTQVVLSQENTTLTSCMTIPAGGIIIK